MAELSIIGNPIVLRDKIDAGKRTTIKFRKFMKFVDIVPVKFNLNFGALFKDNKKSNKVVQYNFPAAIADYEKKLSDYGLSKKSGVRLLLTSDTIAQEEISNVFQDNKIETLLNSIGGYSESIKSIRDFGRSAGVDSINDAINKSNKNIGKSAVVSQAQKDIASIIKTVSGDDPNGFGAQAIQFGKGLGKLAANVFSGKRASLPKIWQQSSYNPSFSLAVKLLSPYGSSKAINTFIVEPLIRLLILTSPTSNDGLTYGDVPYVHIHAYGIANINLGFIESVSIRRGGDEITYNNKKQPLSVDLNISIRPAVSGFATLLGGTDTKFSTVDRPASEIATTMSEGIAGITTIGNIIKSFRPSPESTAVVPKTTAQVKAEVQTEKEKPAKDAVQVAFNKNKDSASLFV